MYKYKWYHYFTILILLIVQPFLSEWLMIAKVKPDFLLMFVVLAAMNKDKKSTLIVIGITGLIYDLLYSAFYSQYVIILFIAIITVWAVNKIAQIEHVPYMTVYGVLLGFIVGIFKVFLELPVTQITTNMSHFLKIALINGLYTGVVFLLISLMYFLISLFSVNTVASARGGR